MWRLLYVETHILMLLILMLLILMLLILMFYVETHMNPDQGENGGVEVANRKKLQGGIESP